MTQESERGSVRAAVSLFALACTIAAAFFGCKLYGSMVNRVGAHYEPLKKGAPFKITSGPAPAGAVEVGDVYMQTVPTKLEEALDELRENMRRVGGNIVARFECSKKVKLTIHTNLDLSGFYLSKRTDMYCKGKGYRFVREEITEQPSE
jgi:hypothetical protein